MEFKEISDFGLNALTFVFIVTLILTTSQGHALIKQNKEIINQEAGDSVNFVFYCYYAFTSLAIIIYGLGQHSLALTVNGFLGFIALAIIYNLLRFKKISLKEKIIGFSFSVSIPLIAFVSQKDWLVLFFGLAFGFVILKQIITIWNKKKTGAFHPEQIFTSIASAFFWSIYALIMGIWPLEVINFLGLLLWLILLFTYLKFKPGSVAI